MNLRVAHLFSGIEGFRYGMEAASTENTTEDIPDITGELPSSTRPIFHAVYSNDIDKYASAISRYHYQDGVHYEGDIRAVDASTIPEHDILCAGFPCQDFSIAGKRAGIEGTRGTLFYEICRVARAKRPSYLWLENVRGLLSADDREAFLTILRCLDDLGYDCQWQVHNSKNYGVPQNRERVFIIGHLRGIRRPSVFPVGESGEESNGSEQGDYTGTVKPGWGNKQNDSTYIVQAIDANYAKGNAGHAGTTRATVVETAKTVRVGGNGSPIDAKQCWDSYVVNGRIRRLTPIECERLQGFPDNWTKYGLTKDGETIEISDTQRYKCCGNAVTTNVITAIGTQLLKAISEG